MGEPHQVNMPLELLPHKSGYFARFDPVHVTTALSLVRKLMHFHILNKSQTLTKMSAVLCILCMALPCLLKIWEISSKTSKHKWQMRTNETKYHPYMPLISAQDHFNAATIFLWGQKEPLDPYKGCHGTSLCRKKAFFFIYFAPR